jgi:hypothetical protein
VRERPLITASRFWHSSGVCLPPGVFVSASGASVTIWDAEFLIGWAAPPHACASASAAGEDRAGGGWWVTDESARW